MLSHSPLTNASYSLADFPDVPDWPSVLKTWNYPESHPVFDLGSGFQLFLARWVLPIAQLPIDCGFVLSKKEHIQAVGSFHELPSLWQEALQDVFHRVCHQGWLLTPGLINTHTHLEQSIGNVIPMPKSNVPDMAGWLLNAKPELIRLFTEPDYQQQAFARGIQELTASGTTCINDISRQGASLDMLANAGIRGTVSLEFFHPDTATLNESILTPVLERYCQLSDQYNEHPFLRVGLSPHSPYNVSPIAWQWILTKVLAHRHESPILHTHLAEAVMETDYIQGKESAVSAIHQAYVGKTFSVTHPSASPVQYLQAHDLLTPKLIAAHSVQVDATDIQLLQTTNVCLAHCPRSNVYLQGNTIDYARYKEANIPVGLGTDGHLSTPGLDIRAEARVARIYHGLNAQNTLELMTTQAATVLNLSNTIGAISPKLHADLALWKPIAFEQNLSPEEQVLSPQTTCHGTWVRANRCTGI